MSPLAKRAKRNGRLEKKISTCLSRYNQDRTRNGGAETKILYIQGKGARGLLNISGKLGFMGHPLTC